MVIYRVLEKLHLGMSCGTARRPRTALFFTDVIYIFLAKYNIKWIILFLVAAGSYADQVLTNPLPWALSAAFVGLGLYWIGNETAKNQDIRII